MTTHYGGCLLWWHWRGALSTWSQLRAWRRLSVVRRRTPAESRSRRPTGRSGRATLVSFFRLGSAADGRFAPPQLAAIPAFNPGADNLPRD
jgi:hypothetical protein